MIIALPLIQLLIAFNNSGINRHANEPRPCTLPVNRCLLTLETLTFHLTFLPPFLKQEVFEVFNESASLCPAAKESEFAFQPHTNNYCAPRLHSADFNLLLTTCFLSCED